MTLVYRQFTRAALDAAYDNRAAVPDSAAIKDAWARRSDALYARANVERDCRYGAGDRERLDFFHAGAPGRPTLAYIHGGYWQWNDKEPHAFIAEGLLARGVNVALVEYTLAPAATMDGIVAEMRRALDWLGARLVREFGAAPTLVLSGHSAGGHLTAMALDHPAVGAALPISGLYDLEPIRLGKLNDPIGMSADDARRNSPLHLPAPRKPCVVTVGAAELPELVRQSREYAAHLRAGGAAIELAETAGDNHFTVLERLAREDGVLCEAAVRLAAQAAT